MSSTLTSLSVESPSEDADLSSCKCSQRTTCELKRVTTCQHVRYVFRDVREPSYGGRVNNDIERSDDNVR